MNSQYYRLISLAEEFDTPSTPKKIEELNELLAATDATAVKPEHFSLLDDLISIMAITGNLTEAHKTAILDLSDKIRVRKLA